MTTALAQRPVRKAKATEEARAQLAAAREKLAQRLDAVERLGGVSRWRRAVQERPLLVLAGALAVGYALGRLFERR